MPIVRKPNAPCNYRYLNTTHLIGESSTEEGSRPIHKDAFHIQSSLLEIFTEMRDTLMNLLRTYGSGFSRDIRQRGAQMRVQIVQNVGYLLGRSGSALWTRQVEHWRLQKRHLLVESSLGWLPNRAPLAQSADHTYSMLKGRESSGQRLFHDVRESDVDGARCSH